MKLHSRKRNLGKSRTFVYDNLETRKVLASVADFNLYLPTGNIQAEAVHQGVVESVSENSNSATAEQTGIETELLVNRVDEKGIEQGPALMMEARIANVHTYYNNIPRFSGSANGFIQAIDFTRLFALETENAHILDSRYVSNYSKGINALLFNVEFLESPNLTISDFRFQWSPQGNFDANSEPNQPQNWEDTPFSPSFISVEPYSPTMTRVRLHWNDNQIENRWLRMTIRATANTGLPQDEVYYHGHLMGDQSAHKASADPGQPHGKFHVDNRNDVMRVRASLGSSDNLPVHIQEDINRDGFIGDTDVLMVRQNINRGLTRIRIQTSAPQRSGPEVDPESSEPFFNPAAGRLNFVEAKIAATPDSALVLWNSDVSTSENRTDEVVVSAVVMAASEPNIAVTDTVFAKFGNVVLLELSAIENKEASRIDSDGSASSETLKSDPGLSVSLDAI